MKRQTARLLFAAACISINAPVWLSAADPPRSAGNRLTYLEERSPFHVNGSFPKLTTPMWFGEEGVDAVVIFAIDDMRNNSEKYRAYLEPILAKLKEVEGRSPLSIFTNTIDPADPQLQSWLSEGVRFDVHTRSHPCPLLKDTLEKASAEFLDCLKNLNRIPGGRPVAFRMPCCDSINSASPRFFSEIFPLSTPEGRFLEIDSSVVMFLDESRRAYAPFRNYAATAEGYLYPYVIQNLIWEFPIIAPSDWQAQNLRKPFHPDTVKDMLSGIDKVVAAQGLYTFCFHPHGWIRNTQIVEIIDQAVARHGRRVRFLNFHDALERLNQNLLGGTPLRAADGSDNGVRLLDLDGDGYLDVVIGNDTKRVARLWRPREGRFEAVPFPFAIAGRDRDGKSRERGVKFAILGPGNGVSAILANDGERGAARFDGSSFVREGDPLEPLLAQGMPVLTSLAGRDRGVRFRDLDGDGLSDLVVNNDVQNAALRFDPVDRRFKSLPFALPALASLVDGEGRDRGLRFADLDGDGYQDLVLSNDDEYYAYLFQGIERGWARRMLHGPAGVGGALPRIASGGRDRGAWFQKDVLYVVNEETSGRPDLVEIRRFGRMLEHMATPPLEPAEALKQFHLPEGFRIELAAAEPLVTDPISIDFGPDGRIWVVEMGNYPRNEGRDAGGRVKVLRDTDGDGVIDSSTLFADGLVFPTGALAHGKGVLVTCAPDILYLEDTDGDGRADVRKVVFTGFGQGNPQHRVNGLHHSIDGWIYGANGDSGGKISSPDHPELPPVSIGGRDFRFRPDLGGFEPATGRTQYGLALDDFGDRFGASNSRHLMHAVLPDRYLRRNPAYAAPEPVLDIPDHGAMGRIYPVSSQLLSLNAIHVPNHFSSACGASIYRGETFPETYRGNSFVCEPVANLVHRDLLIPEGASYRAERAEKDSDFLTSSDHWFRPVYTATGPDGSLYVVDMYRYVIEHPEYIPEEIQGVLDFTAGRDRGRIYRVVHGERPPGKRPSMNPDLTREATGRLVALLEHPNGWWRDTAQRLLVERNDRSAAPALRDLAASAPKPASRVHALSTLEGLGEMGVQVIVKALNDPDPRVREHGLRLAEGHFSSAPALAAKSLALARDPSFRVRLQAAFTLGEIEGQEAGDELLALLRKEGADRFLVAAVLSSSGRHAARMLSLLTSKEEENRRPLTVPEGVLQSLLRVVARKGDRRELAAVLAPIQSREQVEGWHLALLRELAESGRLEDGKLVPEVSDAKNESLARALRLLRERSREILLDPRQELAARGEAARALGDSIVEETGAGGGARGALSDLLSPGSPVELQLAVVSALGRARGWRTAPAAKRLLESWPQAGPTVRTEILEALLSTREGARAVLDAVAEGRLSPREIDPRSRGRLERSEDPSLREAAAKLLGKQPVQGRAEAVSGYRTGIAGLKGDAARGKEVFQKNCSSCHRIEGQGFAVGPDLTEARAKDDGELLEAILNPSGMVPPRYTPYLVETRSGGISTGIISSETATSLTLSRAGGVSETVLRADLKRLTASSDSLMPAELEKAISHPQMADLLEFLKARPRPLSSLTAFEIDAARTETLRAGHNGLLQIDRAPEEVDQKSWVGSVTMRLVRQLDGKGELIWRTEPAPAELAAGSRYTLRFPAAMGYWSQPGGKFSLYLGGRALLDFDVSLETRSWKSADGSVELRYTARAKNEEDSTGLMTLELPGSLLEPGKPATLRVTGSASGSRRWFGLLPLR
jgi:putative membrane-bound dehydrogenase-like protein